MQQAKESLGEAKALLDSSMDAALAVNNLYYAFYYPVIALVYQGRVPDAMQSVAIGLFEQQYINTGTFPREFSDAVHRVFDLKPKCSSECATVTPEEIVRLLGVAQDFIAAVGLYLQLKTER
jgi:uncharacterized protein (UPF0332 family)